MTTDIGGKTGIIRRLFAGRTTPVIVVVLGIFTLWYVAAVLMNTPWQKSIYERQNITWTTADLIRDTMAQDRPVLPAPHQVAVEIYKTTVLKKITSKRSLIWHSWVTLSSTLLGFIIGTVLGIVLATLPPAG